MTPPQKKIKDGGKKEAYHISERVDLLLYVISFQVLFIDCVFIIVCGF